MNSTNITPESFLLRGPPRLPLMPIRRGLAGGASHCNFRFSRLPSE